MAAIKRGARRKETGLKLGYGWIPDLPDHRDILYGAVHRVPARLPSSVDLRRGCSPVEDQGDLGSCTANALAGAVEFLEKKDRVPLTRPREKVLGGHAVLAVGYDDAKKRFLVRNSWGTGWGMNGYFTMPYDYLANRGLSDDFWTIRRQEGF